MASLSDWQNRLTILQDQIQQLEPLVVSYTKHTRATDDILKRVAELEDEKGTLENKISETEEAATTFDREFIERKSDQPGLFKVDKLYTIQDFTMFFFFVSYAILIVALSLTFDKKLPILFGGVFIFVLVLVFLFRSA